MWTYAVEDVHPALHGDALEHGKDCKQDVVKIGDTEVGSSPVLSAQGPVGTRSCWGLQTTRPVYFSLTWWQGEERGMSFYMQFCVVRFS